MRTILTYLAMAAWICITLYFVVALASPLPLVLLIGLDAMDFRE